MEETIVSEGISQNLRQLRQKAGLTQEQLAVKMYVDRSTIARWEKGYRIPDLIQLQRLAACLGVPVAELIENPPLTEAKRPLILVVDDEKTVLEGSLRVLADVLPAAEIVGFTKPSEAIVYCQKHPVNVAFLDIEIGKSSGLDLCSRLTEILPMLNVIFLTAYAKYSLDAWETQACGFLVKPLAAEDVNAVMAKLRVPLPVSEDEMKDDG